MTIKKQFAMHPGDYPPKGPDMTDKPNPLQAHYDRLERENEALLRRVISLEKALAGRARVETALASEARTGGQRAGSVVVPILDVPWVKDAPAKDAEPPFVVSEGDVSDLRPLAELFPPTLHVRAVDPMEPGFRPGDSGMRPGIDEDEES